MKEVFLQLVRLGIGTDATVSLSDGVDWDAVETLAKQHGMMGIVCDAVQEFKGLRGLCQENLPPLTTWLRWIGEVQLEEERYNHQWNEACKMAQLFHQNQICTYVLKGVVVSECYPKPQHRVSSDVDCFLLPEEGDFDAWDKGNHLIEETGGDVEKVFYKNSTFHLPGLTVEDHRYMVPFRGNKTLRKLEWFLQSELKEGSKSSRGSSSSRFEGTELWRPPVMVSALFLIEHAYSHFLHEGLTWRHVLDWVMFSQEHKDEINWVVFDAKIDEFGFRKFYDVFNTIGQEAFGIGSSRIRDLENSTNNSQLDTDSKHSASTCELVERKHSSKQKSLMIADIWAPLDVHDSVRGFKGKLALVGNTWRARWKYRYFTDMSWLTALWIQVKGFLFEKNPKLC